MDREVERFLGRKDDGQIVEIVIRERMIVADTLAKSRRLGGSRSASLADGRALNRLDAETFQIVETDEIVRKIA